MSTIKQYEDSYAKEVLSLQDGAPKVDWKRYAFLRSQYGDSDRITETLNTLLDISILSLSAENAWMIADDHLIYNPSLTIVKFYFVRQEDAAAYRLHVVKRGSLLHVDRKI